MGIEDYLKTLFAAFMGNAQMGQQQQGQAQQISNALGGTPQQPPNTTASGQMMFAPDASGNLYPAPAGTYGQGAYMNQQQPPHVSTLFSTPQGLMALKSALMMVNGGGNP